MTTPHDTFAALLLAGGRSTRMGRDKAALPWGESTLIAHQADLLARTGASPRLLGLRRAPDHPPPPGFRLLLDRPGARGPAEALAVAFREIDADVLLVLAVDLPLVTTDLLANLASRALALRRSVVPRTGTRYEPFCAAWHREQARALTLASAASRPLQEVCAELERDGRLEAYVHDREGPLPWFNVNTPGDWEQARRVARFPGSRDRG